MVSIGRLDLNTEGLLLLTNDGGLARALELPATGWLRRYRVRAHGRVTQTDLDKLRQGITVGEVRYGAIEATLERAQAEHGANVWITFAMREGKNREIRNVLGALGLQVNRLIRVSFGPFQLGDLPAGATEEIKTRALREQIGERLAAISGADFSAPIVERTAPIKEREVLTLPPRSGGEGRLASRSDESRGGGKASRRHSPTPRDARPAHGERKPDRHSHHGKRKR